MPFSMADINWLYTVLLFSATLIAAESVVLFAAPSSPARAFGVFAAPSSPVQPAALCLVVLGGMPALSDRRDCAVSAALLVRCAEPARGGRGRAHRRTAGAAVDIAPTPVYTPHRQHRPTSLARQSGGDKAQPLAPSSRPHTLRSSGLAWIQGRHSYACLTPRPERS